MKRATKSLKETCKVDWGNTSLTKKSYVNNGQFLGVSAAGIDGKMDHFEHEIGVTVISAIGANCGKIFFPGDKFTAIKNTITLTPNIEVIYPRYLFYSLQNNRFPKRGAGQPFITKGDVEKYQVSIAPLPEQKRIVEILEKADTLRRKRQEADKLSDDIEQSIFMKMFGDPNINPKKWAISSLEKICLSKGRYGSGAAATQYDPNKPRYVRITDIDSSGYLNSDKVSPNTSRDEWKDYVLEGGDIIFARSGATVGKTYLYRKEDKFCVYAGYLIRFKPNTKLVHPDYLFSFTKTNFYKNWVKSKMKTAAQPNINAKQYGLELLLPIPPLPDQQKFADLVQEINKIKERQQESKKELDNLFNSLMQKAFN